jgi:hypothetical protein
MTAGAYRLLAVFLLFAAGCSGIIRPDAELYARLAARKQHPIIIIPGVMGSRLVSRQTGEEIWPVSVWHLLLDGGLAPLSRLAALLDFGPDQEQELQPTGLLFEAYGEDFYRNLSTMLGDAGYRCQPAAELGPQTDCVLFAWDWRRDLVEAAAALDRLIERLRASRGDPQLKMDLIAHSASGLVARYFIRFGARDVLDQETAAVTPDLAGARKVRKLALIGVPNQESIFNLQRLMRGYQLGLLWIPPELMAALPSVYQLLPHPDRGWMIDSDGQPLKRNLYDPQLWRALGESIFAPAAQRRIRERFASAPEAAAYLSALEQHFERALERGKRFHRALSSPLPALPIDYPEYIVLGSDCILTPAVCLLETVQGEAKLRLHPAEVARRIEGVDYERLMLEPGDGRVTRSSLLARTTLDPAQAGAAAFPIDYLVFACEDHAELAGDFTIQHNLLSFLLY